MSEIVYVLTNEATPKYVKIGRTSYDLIERMRQLDTTGVALPYECFYAVEVADAAKVKRSLHQAFEDQRVRKAREFFEISPSKAKAILELVAIRDVTPARTVETEPGDKEAVANVKKKRSTFDFQAVGIAPGTVLQSMFDGTTTCTVLDDRRVEFRGKSTSLSASALEIAREHDREWTTICGPDYWLHNGRRLSELRE
jgi:hypothetical protein